MTLTPLVEATPQAPERSPRGHRFLGAAPVPWGTVVVLAVLLAFADGFVVTTVRDTVGAVERTGTPFQAWLQTSALLVPPFLVAVLGGLAFARRRLGPALVRPLRVLAAAVIIAAAGSLVGTAAVAVSTAYDYHLQSEALQSIAVVHHHVHHAGGAASTTGSCTVCTEQQDSLAADVRATRIAGRVILLADVVIVLWVTAMRGGRWDRVPRTRRA